MAGRPSKSRQLDIWMNGHLVGRWTLDASGRQSLTYDQAWVGSIEARPLSLSLPFQVGQQAHRGQAVENYFDNLLPDSDITRKQLAQRYKAQSTQPFDLLAEAGRDCVGAVQLLPSGQTPHNLECIDGCTLTESNVASLLRSVKNPRDFSLGMEDGSGALEREFNDGLRLSIAGAQEKTALLWHEGQWLIPSGSTPTTHIFKLPMGHIGMDRRLDMTTSVENEWLCLRILNAYGLQVPKAAILRFEDQKALVVERFDRELHSSSRWWLRLPQEDFCQATATPSLLKYESEGGPGMERIATYLQGSEHAEQDLVAFFKVQVLFWMLAATDGHAKNFSIRLLRGQRYHLTAFYDVLSAWPIVGDTDGKTAGKVARQKVKLAMSVRETNPGKTRHYNLDTIRRDHFEQMAHRFGLGNRGAALIDELIEQTPGVIQAVSHELPQQYPRHLFDVICNNLLDASKRLQA